MRPGAACRSRPIINLGHVPSLLPSPVRSDGWLWTSPYTHPPRSVTGGVLPRDGVEEKRHDKFRHCHWH